MKLFPTLILGHRLPDFARGIHPPDRKEMTCELPIEELPPPDVVTIPLQQHAGKPALCIVKPRQKVVRGELIGRADSTGLSSNIHSSVTGVVQAITAVPLPNGRRSLAVPIRTDHAPDGTRDVRFVDELFANDWPASLSDPCDPNTIFDKIESAGIVGMGGAAFPTHVKLAANPQKPIESLLVNGCECEPYLTSDDRLMQEFPRAVIAGVKLAQLACDAQSCVVAVESNKPQAIDALTSAARPYSDIEITTVRTKYPMGGERELIPAVFGVEVPMHGLPLDLGITVINVATAAAIASATVRGNGLTHRVLTVTGRGVTTPKNLFVPIGSSFEYVINACDGLNSKARRIVAGGPMMGFTVTDMSVPVTKGTGGITVISQDELDDQNQAACIRCGQCLDVCPLGLAPTKIAHASKHGDFVLANEHHVTACCECGCCAYVCPSQIPLVQYIRIGKIGQMSGRNQP